jgi:hypothetical protein
MPSEQKAVPKAPKEKQGRPTVGPLVDNLAYRPEGLEFIGVVRPPSIPPRCHPWRRSNVAVGSSDHHRDSKVYSAFWVRSAATSDEHMAQHRVQNAERSRWPPGNLATCLSFQHELGRTQQGTLLYCAKTTFSPASHPVACDEKHKFR